MGLGQRLSFSRWVGLAFLAATIGCAGPGSDDGDTSTGGGGGGGDGPCEAVDTPSLSYTQNIEPLIVSRCAYSGCHVAPNPPEGLNLEAGTSYEAMVNVSSNQRPSQDLVVPGNPELSYVFQKIITDQGISGIRMPLGCPGLAPAGGCMTPTEEDAVRVWIEECALDN